MKNKALHEVIMKNKQANICEVQSTSLLHAVILQSLNLTDAEPKASKGENHFVPNHPAPHSVRMEVSPLSHSLVTLSTIVLLYSILSLVLSRTF